MEKWEKTAIATSNTQRFKIGRPDYKSADGRTYQLDRKVPSGKACIKTCAIRLVRDRPSLMDVYRIEHWLSGRGIYHKTSVPKADREHIIQEYQLRFDAQLRRYFNTEEIQWALFQERFPEAITAERITSYGELLYRAKYRR